MEKLIEPITTPEGLSPLLEALGSTSEVYLDTEADSMYHYREKICLMQFTVWSSGKEQNFLVDPLTGMDLQELMQRLRDHLLIFHGADYDLRLLKTTYDFTPREIFDTMLAARLAGHKMLGLDALVERYAGVTLDHGAQKADWSRRPLTPRLLTYAVNDTRHLPKVHESLKKELASLGRADWHRQQCRQLVENSSRIAERENPDPWRIKGSFGLDRQNLAILRELWKWREEEAKTWDRPPFMVCSPDKLIELTHWTRSHPNENPRNSQAPLNLPPRWPPRVWKTLGAAMKRAGEVPPADWPTEAPRGKRPPFDPHFSLRVQRMKSYRDARATELALEPSILVPQAILEALAGNPPRQKEDFSKLEKWLPWQTEILGEGFIQACTGGNSPSQAGNSETKSP